jgi:hypothetical protein
LMQDLTGHGWAKVAQVGRLVHLRRCASG